MSDAEGCVFPNARQCTATSKRTRKRCRAPAASGRNVCRFHGGATIGRSGPANPAYRHGLFTCEAIAERRAISAMLREARALIRGAVE